MFQLVVIHPRETMMPRTAMYLAQLRREIRDVRPKEPLVYRPCIEDRDLTEAPFVSMLALYICERGLVKCNMAYGARRYMLESFWRKLLEYFTPDCGVYRVCQKPYVLVPLAGVELVSVYSLGQLRERAIRRAAAWMCSGPHNVRRFTHDEACKYLSGLHDRTLVPPPPQPSGAHCIGCIVC